MPSPAASISGVTASRSASAILRRSIRAPAQWWCRGGNLNLRVALWWRGLAAVQVGRRGASGRGAGRGA
eukprot:scaffold52016_cov45-Phaeocystis_antarctica.AAC.2